MGPGTRFHATYIENGNGKFRDESLNQHWFVNVKKTRRKGKRGENSTMKSALTAP
jgi:hypothetical protein